MAPKRLQRLSHSLERWLRHLAQRLPNFVGDIPGIRHAYQVFLDANQRVLPEGRVRVDTGEFEMVVIPRASDLGRSVYIDGTKGSELTFEAIIEALAFDGMTYVDVGANWGYFVLVVTSSATPEHVIAFEPEALNVEILRENFESNDVEGTIVEKAVSDETASSVPWESDDNLEEASLSNTGDATDSMASIRLSDYFEQANVQHVDLLKIDVEGAEGLVLDGLGDAIDRVDGIAVEIHSGTISDFGHSVSELLSDLLNKGFDLYHTDNAGTAQEIDESDLQEMDVAATFRMTPRTVHSVFAMRPDTEIGARLSAERFQELAG